MPAGGIVLRGGICFAFNGVAAAYAGVAVVYVVGVGIGVAVNVLAFACGNSAAKQHG